MGNFKTLKVWLLSKDLAVEIYKLTDQGSYKRDFGLIDQMRRSSVSISSNIAEGDELETNRQSIRHLFIARGSTAELNTQLTISKEIGFISEELYQDLEIKCQNVSAMITNLIKHRKNHLPPST